MRHIESVRTPHQQVEVWQDTASTEFRVEGAIHAWHHRERFLSGLAWDLIAAGCLLHPDGPPRRILMLGLGGGTSLRILRHLIAEGSQTAVEMDPGMLDLASRYMDLDALDVRVIRRDAYEWLKSTRKPLYDIVFDDIYLAGKEDVFRPRELDAGTLELMRRRLHPNGLLGVNLVIGRGHRNTQSRTRRALREMFPVVTSLRTPDTSNEVLMAGPQTASAGALKPYRNQFKRPKDREYWDRIRLRRLP